MILHSAEFSPKQKWQLSLSSIELRMRLMFQILKGRDAQDGFRPGKMFSTSVWLHRTYQKVSATF